MQLHHILRKKEGQFSLDHLTKNVKNFTNFMFIIDIESCYITSIFVRIVEVINFVLQMMMIFEQRTMLEN